MSVQVREVMSGPDYEERQGYDVLVVPSPDVDLILREEEEKLRADFVRNLKLALYKDGQVLLKAAMSLGSLTEREFEYWKKVRPFYTAGALNELDRALSPEYQDQDGTRVTTTVTVTVGKHEVDNETAKRAAAKQLLDKFTVSTAITLESQEPEPIPAPAGVLTIDADYDEI